MKKLLAVGAFLFAGSAFAMEQHSTETKTTSSEADTSPFKIDDLRVLIIKTLFKEMEFHSALVTLQILLCVDKTFATFFKANQGLLLCSPDSSLEEERSLQILDYIVNSGETKPAIGVCDMSSYAVKILAPLLDKKAINTFNKVPKIYKKLKNMIEKGEYEAFVGIVNDLSHSFKRRVLCYNESLYEASSKFSRTTLLLPALEKNSPEKFIQYLISQGSSLGGLPSTTLSPCFVVFQAYCEDYELLKEGRLKGRDSVVKAGEKSLIELNTLMDLLLASGACINDESIKDGIRVTPLDLARATNNPELISYIEKKGASNAK